MNPHPASTPPSGLLPKLSYYRKKYGLVHAVSSYIGRSSRLIWRWVGPSVTKRYRQRWLRAGKKRVLNLGGGGHCLVGCLTVDVDARADVYVDITQPLPFPDCSIEGIFCEEVIEHVDYARGAKLLRECWRILQPGGVLRLTTPSLNWFAARLASESEAWSEMNSIFYDHAHRCIYTEEALQRSCMEAGFVLLLKSSYRDPRSKLGYLDSHADRYRHPQEMSQYLEASKPLTLRESIT